MSRRAAALVVGGAAVLAALALLWWATTERGPSAPPTGVRNETATAAETATVELFFPNTAGWLGGESRELPAAPSAEARAAQIAAALLSGPTLPGLLAPLAEAVELASLHLSADGLVYVDLAATQMATPPVSGSRGELLAVYSFVNSILANVPEARGVVLLWNGSQRPTFAGHVDTTRPLPVENGWLGR